MATCEELRDFLVTRRARITPEQAGLPSLGHRRVPGLRREEVATLTGVSSEYYTRLERGNANAAQRAHRVWFQVEDMGALGFPLGRRCPSRLSAGSDSATA